MKDNLLVGMTYLWRGFGSLSQPGIRRYVWLPIIINLVLLGGGIYLLTSELISWPGFDSGWLSWLAWLIIPLFILLTSLISGYFFSAILLLIASPFYGLLAGEIEKQQGVLCEDEPLSRLIVRTLLRELVKIKYYLPRYLLLLILSFIPGINLLMPFVWFWFGSWVMALQYSDYTFDNQGISFEETRAKVASARWSAWGFGGSVSLLMAIPVVNCFVPPAAVIGATLWQAERTKTLDDRQTPNGH